MATTIAHFIVGAAAALPMMASRGTRPVLPGWTIPVTAGLWAVLPDLDTYLMISLGLPIDNLFSHRGFFHSPFFLIIVSAVIAAVVARRQGRDAVAWLALTLSASAVTHPLLDMLTDGGSGVTLLLPFSGARQFFPWRPIHISGLDIIRLFPQVGGISLSELPVCAWAVSIGILGLLLRTAPASRPATEGSNPS